MSGPLAGIRVVEVANWLAVPATGALLVDMGAEVIKIEPREGDAWRQFRMESVGYPGPFPENVGFQVDNRGKRSIAIDIASEVGGEVVLRLLQQSDVLLTNLLPRRVERYGLNYEEVSRANPRLIALYLTGYGDRGPDRDRPGFDYTAFWVRSGMMSLLSPGAGPPIMQRPGMGDHTTCWLALSGVLAALYEREKSGRGQKVVVTLMGAGVWVIGCDIQASLITRQNPAPRSRTELRSLRRRFPRHLLADSPEGVKKESEITGLTPPDYKTESDIKKGFVYRRVPHVTLKSIANNPDIKEGMTREEIDGAIARDAETETLYDQPYDDPKRIRVTGPFTVESLSPHRVLSGDEERPESEREAMRAANVGQFETMILENLKKAGVQNTRKSERLTFDRLEPYAGEWLHAEGEYTDAGDVSRRVAVSLGPEHGTVGAEQVKEAAKEAMKGAGFHLLIVCGFAFDAHAGETAKEFSPDGEKRDERAGFVTEETRQYGKLPVLLARMNPDLAMGDELLKKTGAGNLFMVFGEPDVSIDRQDDGKLVVEIRGLDVYDPTTGQIRSSTTDDIACWFIDTEYNDESFFVRHAYFTGAEEPYDKLKRALRAEIDEAAWLALYSTRSYPFDPPSTGKIAVKVINHYGDEVLKVYEV